MAIMSIKFCKVKSYLPPQWRIDKMSTRYAQRWTWSIRSWSRGILRPLVRKPSIEPHSWTSPTFVHKTYIFRHFLNLHWRKYNDGRMPTSFVGLHIHRDIWMSNSIHADTRISFTGISLQLVSKEVFALQTRYSKGVFIGRGLLFQEIFGNQWMQISKETIILRLTFLISKIKKIFAMWHWQNVKKRIQNLMLKIIQMVLYNHEVGHFF